jgi:hypothetical protein
MSLSSIVRFRWAGRRTAIGVLLAAGVAAGAGVAPHVMANESHDQKRPAARRWVNAASNTCLTVSLTVPVEGPTIERTVTAVPCDATLAINQRWTMAGTHLKNNLPTGTVCLEARDGRPLRRMQQEPIPLRDSSSPSSAIRPALGGSFTYKWQVP